jgi:hypothetical protein
MADGIRIQPQRARLAAEGVASVANRMFVIRDRGRPLPPVTVCRHCGYPHDCKAYHFQLDGEGTIIVSTKIWENLLKMPDHGGFERVNVVAKPPTQGILLPTAHIKVTPATF